MAGTTDYTDDQKKGFLVLAQKQGRGPAAKKAKVTTQTIRHWAKKFGVELKVPHPDAAKKRRRIKRKPRANGKANGHAAAAPSTSGELERLENDLATSLQRVQQMRKAFSLAFGA